jgi:hypothetical protein
MTDYTVIDIETTGSLPWEHELVSVGIGLGPSVRSRFVTSRAPGRDAAHTS